MSRVEPTSFEREQLTTPCNLCGAAPGEWCKTPSGRWTAYLHGRPPHRGRKPL